MTSDEARFSPEALEAFRQRCLTNESPPPLEIIGPTEFNRRRKRHLEHGVPMNVPSCMEWPQKEVSP